MADSLDCCRECGEPMTRVPDDHIAWECVPCDTAVRVRITDTDRTALAAAVHELKERRGAYQALLARCTPATDAFVTTAYREGIEAVEAAVKVCERLAKGGA